MRHSIGWKAIIYDATWAYFKDGQPGVIVTQDKKTCETTNDDISSIKIVADENPFFVKRTGRVKFIQNDSEKEQDVELIQAGKKHVYELFVQDVTMNGCSATYETFTGQVTVYWVVDGVRDETPIGKNDYSIITPVKSDFTNAKGGKTLQIKVNAVREDDGNTYTGLATCTIEPAADPTTEYSGTYISSSSVTCSMVAKGKVKVNPSDSTITCSGNVSFSTEKISWPKYKVSLTGMTAKDKYVKKQCGVVIDVTEEDVQRSRMTFTVSGQSGAYENVEVNAEKTELTLNVKPEGTFRIRLKVSKQTTGEVQKISNIINTADLCTS